MIFTINLATLKQTKEFAKILKSILKPGHVITLRGDLGVGKTTLTRFLINAYFFEEQEVPSPSYTLVQTYQTSTIQIYHFDLYRLKEYEEIFELGIEDALAGGVSIIEWPELILHLLPEDRLDIELIANVVNDERRAIINATDEFVTIFENNYLTVVK
ncbi:MAG: hypothetical protein RIT35_1289 [Pseudomonadota bacterium]|jgi:tRNA threonylcarbamoyladenosine biosynthesis protein TsaE